jgi:hypothetical protein
LARDGDFTKHERKHTGDIISGAQWEGGHSEPCFTGFGDRHSPTELQFALSGVVALMNGEADRARFPRGKQR